MVKAARAVSRSIRRNIGLQVIYSAEDVEKAKKYITDHGITSVEIGFADINGSIIGKRLPGQLLPLRYQHLYTAKAVAERFFYSIRIESLFKDSRFFRIQVFLPHGYNIGRLKTFRLSS